MAGFIWLEHSEGWKAALFALQEPCCV